jgi:hypothetical protein
MIKKWKKFNENSTEHQIEFDGQGVSFYENQTEVSYIIDGEVYMFTLYEKGETHGKVDSTDFVAQSDLPFELTQEMKDEMYDLYANN